MQIFLTLFFVFGLFCDGLSWGADVLSLAPKTNEWVEDYDSIVLKELQRQGLIKGTILKKKAIVPRNSTQASRLLFIKTRLLNGEDISYVVKENIAFEDSYEEEKKLIEDKTISSYQKVINDYSKTHGVKLPELISYHSATKVQVKGHTIRLTIMSKARGDTLADIEDALKIIDTENTPPFTEEQAITMGTEIGKQMGHLTRAFFERNRSILFHNDTGPQNFMYDPKKKQMYWIDLGGIDTTQYATNNPLSYLAFEGGMIQTIWKSFFLVPPSSSTQDFDNLWKINEAHNMSLKNLVTSEGINVLKKYRLGILAGEAFYNAYYDQVKNLSPTIENSKNRFSYVAQTTAWKDFYRQKIIDHFGPDAQRVLDYLFAPAQAEPPFDKINSMSDGVRAIETELRESIPNTKKLLDIISGKSGAILRRGPSQKELQVMLRAFKIIASDQGLDVEGFFKAQKFLKVSMTPKTHQTIVCGVLLILRAGGIDTEVQGKLTNIFGKITPALWIKIKTIASM